jgi:hypothetical protein
MLFFGIWKVGIQPLDLLKKKELLIVLLTLGVGKLIQSWFMKFFCIISIKRTWNKTRFGLISTLEIKTKKSN